MTHLNIPEPLFRKAKGLGLNPSGVARLALEEKIEKLESGDIPAKSAAGTPLSEGT